MTSAKNPNADDRLAGILVNGFDAYFEAFSAITHRACHRFESRDWAGMRKDTVERLDLYPLKVAQTVAAIDDNLGERAHRHSLWEAAKQLYYLKCSHQRDTELAATFFNSVNRRLFSAAEFESDLTFIDLGSLPRELAPEPERFTAEESKQVSEDTIRTIIGQYGFKTPFVDFDYAAAQCADRINAIVRRGDNVPGPIRLELLKSPFFRGMSAYLVGRMKCGTESSPLVLALNNSSRGLYIDALLSRDEEVRIMFSFTRAYFHVQTKAPSTLARYLKQLMPSKRLAEIYIGLGFHKHGKTELYRDLLKHQEVCGEDRFDFSPGQHGMVMITFNMPGDDLIYKLIRDRFDSPKKTTTQQVMQKYDYVFKHDRAGRLVDVQTFENLQLDECCFTSRLLQEIRNEASHAASIVNGRVTLHHSYVQRRVTPLDIYLQVAGPADSAAAIIDFGQAIKDLAHINVFPGDMLIKNFGVTNLGRVVFYDYDELCPLTDCVFRKLPQSRNYEDEMSAEPWYTVGDHDVFPEEFAFFMGLPPELGQRFKAHHGDLLEPDFWKKAQHHIRAGTWFHIRPYGRHLRLPRKNGTKNTG